MRKIFKKITAAALAATLALGACGLAACDGSFRHPEGIPEGEVSSNGGFVVSKGDYWYFINGVETYSSDNTYGVPVKGALMRVKKSDVAAKQNSAEVVVPSLMVAGDYTAGLFIYGDRVYYATPTNVRNTTGVVENTYLDFQSAKLDGSDVKTHFRLADNATVYRFVEAGEGEDKGVYVLYAEGSSSYTIHSYDLTAETDTVLVKAATSYVLDSSDKTDPTVYYTMGVTDKADSAGALRYDYNQLYRVRADAKEGAYQYEWDQEYLDAETGGEPPYYNLGEIVLDGIGFAMDKTQFNHSESEPATPAGYVYALRSYKNGGVYFTRTSATDDSSTGGKLYFLAESKTGSGWDSVSGNAESNLDVVANAVDASAHATDTAFFYLDEAGKHHYLYVDSNVLYRADVQDDGSMTDLAVAYGVGSATVVAIDTTSDAKYDYAYFTRANGGGLSVERAVFNGEEDNYKNLPYDGVDNAAYQPVKVLDLQHASGWYNYEVMQGENVVFFADAEAFGSTSYNYVSAVSLAKADGTLMNNAELEAFNDKYDAITDSSASTGFLAKLTDGGNTKLSNAIRYYFYTHETRLFDGNIADAVAGGKKQTYLYDEKEQAAFRAYTEGKGYTDGDKELFAETAFADGETSYRTYDYFVTKLGTWNETDTASYDEYWAKTGLEHYVPVAAADTGLPAWAWALIGIAIGAVLCGAGVAVWLVVRKKKKQSAPKEEKQVVRTTGNEEYDLYAVPEEEPVEAPDESPAEEPVEESAEEPAEEPVEESAEEPVEESAEEPVETPAEETAEQPAEAPAEETAEEPVEAPAEKPSEE